MAVFPLFINLSGQRCIVVGGGEVASRKVEVLLRFEADISVIAPEAGVSIKELESLGKIKILCKEYSERDIDGAFLVVAATSSIEVNERVFLDAKKRNIPVNTVDDPEKCTFIFPSVIKRGNLTIGISTSGTYPALSKKLRKIAEGVFTDEYSSILDELAHFRLKVRKSRLDRHQREEVLKRVVEEFFSGGDICHQALLDILNRYETELQDI